MGRGNINSGNVIGIVGGGMNASDKQTLSDLKNRVGALEDSELYRSHVYGVIISEYESNPVVQRVGDMELHRTLPLQSQMKGGLLTDDGTFTPFTSVNDWTQDTKARDGSEGQVMVLLPEYWRKVVQGNGYFKWLISDVEIEGFEHVGSMYVGAYQAALDRTNLKLCSIVNTDPQFRGGNNASEWDGTYRSLLGTNATGKSTKLFRDYARNRGAGWEQFNFYVRETIVWFYVIEYANRNSQADYDSTPDGNGCHRGGLGMGVTALPDPTGYNNDCPFIPCGVSDTLGNRSGVVTHNVLASDGVTVYYAAPVNRYRGIEMPFGHCRVTYDGIFVEKSPDVAAGGTGLSKVFIAHDPANWGDLDVNDPDKYEHVANMSRLGGYITKVSAGHIIPEAADGGSATTYYCDNIIVGGVQYSTLIISPVFASGASSSSPSSAGLFYVYCGNIEHSYSHRNLGTRITYIG